MDENITHIIKRFNLDGVLADLTPIKRGHINDTYICTVRKGAADKSYVLQRVNHYVFKNVPALMENVAKVTKHLATKIDFAAGERTLQLVLSREGQNYVTDEQGNFWRAYEYVQDAETFDVCKSPELAFAAGAACGRFQNLLSDLSPLDFYETIPFFHHTPHRFQSLQDAVTGAATTRLQAADKDLKFALARINKAGLIVDGMKKGQIPIRVTHNDLKLNNILFKTEPYRGVCVLDLDTCMAGSALYDFGDLVRNVSVAAAEDEKDLGKISLNLEYFEKITQGFLGEVGPVLSKGELELLALAPQIIALELGVRFLTDYFSGDVYFKTKYAEHNIDRARSQFKTVSNLEAAETEMKSIVAKLSPA